MNKRLASRYLNDFHERAAGLIEPPPIMLSQIMDWLTQVLAAREVVRLETELAWHADKDEARIAELRGYLEIVHALQAQPTNWKVYKTFVATLGALYTGDIPFKDFTGAKNNPELYQKLSERVLRGANRADTDLTENMNGRINTPVQLQRAVQENLGRIHDPHIIRGTPGDRRVSNMMHFPVDLTGWKLDGESLKDKIRDRIQKQLQPMIDLVKTKSTEQGVNEVRQEMLQTFEGQFKNARESFPIILVMTDGTPKNAKASWTGTNKTMTVGVSNYYDESVIADLRRSVAHELRHFVQTYLGHMTGHMDKAMNAVQIGKRLQHIPRPGMPSKKIMTPGYQQSFTRERWEGRQIPEEYKESIRYVQQQGIYPSELHSLDDIEFYTDLADAVAQFRKMKNPDWTDEETRKAIRLFIHADRLQDNDPDWKQFRGIAADKFFVVLKNRAPGKWKKAVSELIKAVL